MARATAVAAVLATSGAAWAVPSLVTLEGALTSSGGGAAPDGSYNVVFGIYKDAAGGTPIWSEGPVSVLVKNGLFAYAIGTKTPLTPAALANLGTAFLGMKVEADAELPRQQVLSTAYALRAGIAEGVDCSGCIAAGALDPAVLAPYAKTADLAAYAKATDLGAYAKATDLAAYAKATDLGAYAKATDLAAYAKTASLKDVATTGAYASLTGTPLLDDVATSGSYKDLSNTPVMAAINSQCGTNLFVKGINADGSLNCGPITLSTDALLAAMPKDGLNEISNDLLSNQFTDSASGTSGLPIWDNSPIGFQVGTPPKTVAAPDVIAVPDLGFAQRLTVNLDVSNSNVSTLEVLLTAPDNTVYYLCGPVTPAPSPYPGGLPTGTPCGTGGKFVKSFGDPSLGFTKPVSGDLTTWVSKKPVGNWKLQIYDTVYFSNDKDGQVNSWSITIQTLSSKKIAVAGNLGVAGAVAVTGNLGVTGNAAVTGAIDGNGGVNANGQAVSSNFKLALINNDFRNNSGTVTADTWADIPARTLTYTKTRAASYIRIMYQDTLGTLGTDYGQCNWRILVDGNVIANFSDADITYGQAWRMANASHTAIATGYSAAAHTIKVQTKRNAAAAECLMGWNTAGNFLSAEEVGP